MYYNLATIHTYIHTYISKCAYQSIERGKRKPENNPIEVNGLEIQEIKDGDNYKYLGVDKGSLRNINQELRRYGIQNLTDMISQLLTTLLPYP